MAADKEVTLDLVLIVVIIGAALYLWHSVTNIFNPNSTGAVNFLANAATGSVTVSQQNDLVAEETRQLIKAGTDPATAAATAKSDVATALANGPSYTTALYDSLVSTAEDAKTAILTEFGL